MSLPYPDLVRDAEPTDCFGMLERMRREDPILYVDQVEPACWFISRHEDVVRLFKEPRLGILKPERMFLRFSEAERLRLSRLRSFLAMRTAVFEDHDVRLRTFAKAFFSPTGIEKLRAAIEELTSSLLDRIDASGPVDFIRAFSKPLPANVIATILGADREDLDDFVVWSSKMIKAFKAFDLETYIEAQDGIASIMSYCEDLLERRIEQPRDDLISHLAATALPGGYSRSELAAYCSILLMSGHETTTQLFNVAVDLLSRYPDQAALLRENRALLPQLIDEAMRYRGVVSGLWRLAREDFEYRGHRFEAGQLVHLSVLSANHDERVFDSPDTFDITRTESGNHLGFGHGVRYCLGSHLAEMEVCIGLAELYSRYPDLQVSGCEVKYPPFCEYDIESLYIDLRR